MKKLNIKIVLFSFIILIFLACGEKYDDKVFWVGTFEMPILEDKNNGGKVIDVQNITYAGQYNNKEKTFQKYKGPIEGSIVSVWEIVRLPNGKLDYEAICGEEPIKPINYSDKNYDDDYETYRKKRNKLHACYKQVTAKMELNKVHKYFYARSKPSLQITYPPRTKRHSHWQVTIYNGRVGDLTPEALTQEQKNNLNKLRQHECYQWGSTKRGDICYDLEGEETSLYYTIREHLYSPPAKDGVVSSQWEGLKDIRISPPQKWIEIKGMSINKEQYDYLKEVCQKGEEYCHLNNYNGKLTKSEKEYINSVKYDNDK